MQKRVNWIAFFHHIFSVLFCMYVCLDLSGLLMLAEDYIYIYIYIFKGIPFPFSLFSSRYPHPMGWYSTYLVATTIHLSILSFSPFPFSFARDSSICMVCMVDGWTFLRSVFCVLFCFGSLERRGCKI